MKVFGIANHSPDSVISELLERKVAKASNEIAVLPLNSDLPAKAPKYRFLLILTTADLKRNLATLNAGVYEGLAVLVFASPMALNRFRGIEPVDFARNPEYPGFGFTLSSLDMSKLKRVYRTPLEVKQVSYLKRIVRYVREGSLLNPLMTFIYSQHFSIQPRLKLLAVKHVYMSKKLPMLEKELVNADIKLSTKAFATVKEILSSEAASRYAQAFAEYRESLKGTKVPVKKLAKTHGVAEYEITYMLSVLADVESSKLYSDSFDKAKNRSKS